MCIEGCAVYVCSILDMIHCKFSVGLLILFYVVTSDRNLLQSTYLGDCIQSILLFLRQKSQDF